MKTEKRNNLVKWLKILVERIVIWMGKRKPVVYYAGVPYYSDALDRCPSIVGEIVQLCVNPEDLHCVVAYKRGRKLGILNAVGIWGNWPNTLEERKKIC